MNRSEGRRLGIKKKNEEKEETATNQSLAMTITASTATWTAHLKQSFKSMYGVKNTAESSCLTRADYGVTGNLQEALHQKATHSARNGNRQQSVSWEKDARKLTAMQS